MQACLNEFYDSNDICNWMSNCWTSEMTDLEQCETLLEGALN